MTPDDRFIQMARFDAAHAKRVWDGSAATEDAPAWYGRVATLIRAAAAPATEDELAGESDIVARMEAAMLEPAAGDELAGETEIVARMQATILGLAAKADDDAGAADDADRPRHLRPAVPWAVRHRQGVRVVRRLVAVKAAAVTTAVAIGVTAAAATTGFVATVVVPALSTNEPKHAEERETTAVEKSESSAEGSGTAGRGGRGGTADDPPVSMDPKEPFTCMIDLDCLIHEVELAAGIAPASAPPTTVPAPPTTTTTEPPTTTTTEPPTPMTTPTTEPPPPPTTTPTTEPPPPPTTTPTTEPPPPEQAAPPQGEIAGPPLEAAPLSASLADSGDATSSVDTQAADLGDVAQPQPAG
jgi:hypothetical protein